MLTVHSLQSMLGCIHCFGLKVRENNTVQEAVTEATFLTVQETEEKGRAGDKASPSIFPVGYIISTSP